MDDPVLRALSGLVPEGIRRGELRRGSRWLRWVESGSGDPAVVLDGPLGQPGSLSWAGVLASVAAHTRVIAYDRAGAGASDPLAPLTLDTATGDLAALISSTGGRCVLAGHSALPDVPLTVLSATTGMPADQRERFTALHADLAATVPGGTHVVLPATGHLIPQERPERVAEAITLVLADISRR